MTSKRVYGALVVVVAVCCGAAAYYNHTLPQGQNIAVSGDSVALQGAKHYLDNLFPDKRFLFLCQGTPSPGQSFVYCNARDKETTAENGVLTLVCGTRQDTVGCVTR